MHLAVALNKKVLAMFENKTDKLKHWYPWRVESRIVHGILPEISSIDLAQVIHAMEVLNNEQLEC